MKRFLLLAALLPLNACLVHPYWSVPADWTQAQFQRDSGDCAEFYKYAYVSRMERNGYTKLSQAEFNEMRARGEGAERSV